MNALAYTIGTDIAFNTGQYRPNTLKGRKLLAHELAHVSQSFKHSRSINKNEINFKSDTDDSDSEQHEVPMTRAEEIRLSFTSPGLIAAENEGSLSLYNFGIDDAKPKTEHRNVLKELGHFLNKWATKKVIVRSRGFASSTGNEDYNLRLSRRRAKEVMAILKSMVPQRISVNAYGELFPVASNDTVEGRSRNRRVDLLFTLDKPPGPVPPRDKPVPPGKTIPPKPKPPGGNGGGQEDDTAFCKEYPILCATSVIPFFAPLICSVAPAICMTIGCALLHKVCIPESPPPPPEPPKKRPKKRDGQPSVIFSPDVRSSNTPLGMRDRIGLRDAVHVSAIVTNPPTDGSTILIFVSDNKSGSGTATINGVREINITVTTQLSVLGTQMTTGNYEFSPYIQLGASWSNELVGESNRFAVSSIIEDWRSEDAGQKIGPVGYISWADMKFDSDSGNRSHLNGCFFVERVEIGSESGCFTGFGIGRVNDPNNPDDLDTGELGITFDEHGTPFKDTRDTRKPGTSRLKQLFTIRDMRSNSDWAASRNSGFEIHRIYERDPANPRCWHLLVKKFGSRVNVNGWISGAGNGNYIHEFRNIDCDKPKEPEPPLQPESPTPLPKTHCDRPEMARRIDLCIIDAMKAAIGCTAILLPPYNPFTSLERLEEYQMCLKRLTRELFECDKKAKRDTNCPDINTTPDCPRKIEPPFEPEEEFYAQCRIEYFLKSIIKNPLKSGKEDKATA